MTLGNYFLYWLRWLCFCHPAQHQSAVDDSKQHSARCAQIALDFGGRFERKVSSDDCCGVRGVIVSGDLRQFCCLD
jgi:hypothetical protein